MIPPEWFSNKMQSPDDYYAGSDKDSLPLVSPSLQLRDKGLMQQAISTAHCRPTGLLHLGEPPTGENIWYGDVV